MIPKKILKSLRWEFDYKILVVTAILLPVHYLLVQLSSVFTFADGTAAIWPSTGIFLATLLIWDQRFWLAIVICDFIVLQTTFYNNPFLSIVISLVDVSDPLVVSWLILKFIGYYPLNRALDTIKFVALLIPYPIISAVIGVTIQCLAGFTTWDSFGLIWRGWFTSTIISMLIMGSVILTWFPPPPRNELEAKLIQDSAPQYYLGEFLLGIIALLGIGYFAFWRGVSIEYMMILPLLWAAFRFRQKQVTSLILLAVGVAIIGTAQGYGSFAQDSVAQSLMLLQSFMTALAIATLVLAAAVQESRFSAAQLQQANDELEARVSKRTAELTTTLEQLQTTQSQLIQQEKMSSLGQLVAGVAHEINNPISFIHGNLDHIQTYTQDLLNFVQLHRQHYPNPVPEIQDKAEEIDLEFLQEDLVKILSSMKIGTDRIRQIVLSLRVFSRMDEAEIKDVDIHEGIDSTLLILQHRLKATPDRPEVKILKNYTSLPLVECYAGQLNQVFMNILVNAIDALDEMYSAKPDLKATPPQITISTLSLGSERVQIAIADNGPGMTELTCQRLFNPFFTTKPIGKGTGMGMSISHQIITDKHNGQLECFSTLGQGTEFLIKIPVKKVQKAGTLAQPSPQSTNP